MARDVKTFRLSKFKGLNTSVNPHNINDAEMTEMVNAETTKDHAIQTRMGYRIVGEPTGSLAMSSLYKADWSSSDSRLYYCSYHQLQKLNETTGASTYLSLAFRLANTHPQFLRYKDKVLFLLAGQRLKWFNSGEIVNDVQLPVMSVVSPDWYTAITATSGGELTPSQKYEYTISLLLGTDLRDGESVGAKPGDAVDLWELYPGIRVDPRFIDGDYARIITTESNKTATASDLLYSGKLYGFTVGAVRLFRRTLAVNGDVWKVEKDWALLDTLYVSRSGASYTVNMSAHKVISAADSSIAYDSVNDAITVSLSFVDSNAYEGDVGYQPRQDSSDRVLQARYMARLYNRIFLANLTSTNSGDKKAVCFSYRPPKENESQEILGCLYDNPMLVFPPNNTFYCDLEDTEDEITAITTFQDTVIIFTQRCMFAWREGMFDPAKIANDVGCIAQHSIREFEGKLIWLSRNGIYTFDGEKLDNISYEKIDYYIKQIALAYAGKACACIYNRRYFLTAPCGSGTNDRILVYDFDLKEWHTREYAHDGDYDFKIQYLYTYRAGNTETLYASGINGDGTFAVARLESDYSDNGTEITATLKTKYFDFGAPDIQKSYRALFIDLEDYTRGLTIDVYTTSLDSIHETITYSGSGAGFLVNDNTGTRGRVNKDVIVNVTDEMVGFSLNRGIIGSRIQLGISFQSTGAPTKLHALALDWRQSHRVKRNMGDGS
jgi:hypothetical protein